MAGFFVDVHSHVVPSGDDGVQSREQGLELCRRAAQRGTGVLFATPHVWPTLPLPEEREEAVREAHAEMVPAAAQAGLELRLGFELTPTPALLEEDPRRYRMEGLATASISRSEARRASDSISIWRTRSRVMPSRRPMCSSVCGSSPRSP